MTLHSQSRLLYRVARHLLSLVTPTGSTTSQMAQMLAFLSPLTRTVLMAAREAILPVMEPTAQELPETAPALAAATAVQTPMGMVAPVMEMAVVATLLFLISTEMVFPIWVQAQALT